MVEEKLNRAPRIAETRDLTQRRKGWQRPTLLPDPPEDPAWTYKWVRASTLGVSDPTNVNAKLREGWEFVSPDDPVAQHIYMVQTDKPARAGTIEIGGLILCRIPREFAAERNAHYQGVAVKQLESFDQSFLKDQDPRMPKSIERSSKMSSSK